MVPGLRWAVVVERPATLALAGAQNGRDLAFAVFLVVVADGGRARLDRGGQLAGPLEGLTRAVDALAFGTTPDRAAPTSGVSEVSRLAAVFGDLRDRLRIRTVERERAERRLRFLADASSHLAASLDYETTLERVAWLAVPTLADWCLVDVLDDDGEIRRVEVAHADPLTSGGRGAAARLPAGPPGRAKASRGCCGPASGADPRDARSRLPAVTRDARHQAIVQSLGARSLMRVPLLARGRTLGVISLISTDPGRRYSATDLALAEELGRRCAVAVDNARLYAESQQAIRARDEFLSIASHELRTPLTGIKGYAQILLRAQARGQLDDERLQRSLATIDDAADRLTALVDDLLDVSRIRTGHLPLRLRRVDLGATFREVTDRYRDHLDEQHALVLDLPDHEVTPSVDVDRLEQVVTNLLSNAVKYSPTAARSALTLVGGEGGALFRCRTAASGCRREVWRRSSSRSVGPPTRRAGACRGWGSACTSAGRSSSATAGASGRRAAGRTEARRLGSGSPGQRESRRWSRCMPEVPATCKRRVLVVDDDPSIQGFLAEALAGRGLRRPDGR